MAKHRLRQTVVRYRGAWYGFLWVQWLHEGSTEWEPAEIPPGAKAEVVEVTEARCRRRLADKWRTDRRREA
jgi:hypothetical protein